MNAQGTSTRSGDGDRRDVLLRAAHEQFVTTGRTSARGVRSLVVESWRRSRSGGVDPELVAPSADLSAADVQAMRREHPLAVAIPAIRHLLVQPAEGWVTALIDDSGRLLWAEGDVDVHRRLERIGFVEGAQWREEAVGTSAPGVALATDAAVQVLGVEHWVRSLQPFNCAAAPVHDPAGRLLGVLDMTGGPVVASGMAQALVRATVVAIEAILRAEAATRGEGHQGQHREPWLRMLGPRGPVLRTPRAETPLSGRQAEILLLLSEHPAGMSAHELAGALSQSDLSHVTVRAEISRLRRLVDPLLSESRPYRLTDPVRTDVAAVRAALEIGDVGLALAGYPGPALPRSAAPGVEQIRTELGAQLRAAVLTSKDADLLRRWTASPEGFGDRRAWRALVAALPVGTAVRLRAATRLAALERDLDPRRRAVAAR